MHRNLLRYTILTMVLIVTILVGLYGCGPSATPTTSTAGKDLVVTSTVNEGHTHDVAIKSYDITDPPVSDKFTTTKAGVGLHTHTVTMTQPEFQAIKDGKEVTVSTSVVMDYNHTHKFVIKK
jgi:hypothetical protein